MKTFKLWDGAIEDYLTINDEVDQALVIHFANIVAPKTFTDNLVQAGTAYDFVNGKAVYLTFERTDGHWFYRGHCHVGETVIPNS